MFPAWTARYVQLNTQLLKRKTKLRVVHGLPGTGQELVCMQSMPVKVDAHRPPRTGVQAQHSCSKNKPQIWQCVCGVLCGSFSRRQRPDSWVAAHLRAGWISAM